MVENGAEAEALRLKTLAEDKYRISKLKPAITYAKRALRLCPHLDGVAELVTAFKILRVAGEPSAGATADWYKVLQLEPLAHINSVKKQYKKLALTLHPDKTPFAASEEAFKLVGEAFRFLSDKVRKKSYDLKLRIQMRSEEETFWTACSTCSLLQQFQRRYVGHKLVCSSCKKRFIALERDVAESSSASASMEEYNSDTNLSRVLDERKRMRNIGLKRKMGSVEEVLGRAPRATLEKEKESDRHKTEVLRSPKNAKRGEEMTLAEMQAQVRRKLRKEKMARKEMEKDKRRECEKEKLSEGQSKDGDLGVEKCDTVKGQNEIRVYTRRNSNVKKKNLEAERKSGDLIRGNLVIMSVADADFYNFDKDRVERSFKKGQVWALYDDDDGMPRHYGLVDEVVSVNPFELMMSWLDLQNGGDEKLVRWEDLGFHISCGKFKVTKKTSIYSVNVFSHLVDSERVARELYCIYPKKGSVWALYGERDLDSERRNQPINDKRCYDIAVLLTSYSETYGLSMAYLRKVDGLRTVFTRKEIGCHAVMWIEKDNLRLFSHQIPARKISEAEAPVFSKDCWELDPASLSPELLTIEGSK